MKQILREEDLPLTGEFRPSAVLGAISRAKNEMLDPDVPVRERRQPPRADDRPARDRATRSACARRTRSTSTTCCSRPSACSRRRPTCSPSTRRRWRYLHVDEYQDTNRAQYLWVKALAAKHRNLCVVGDDDQSIYSGAARTCATSSTSSATGRTPTVVKLEQNYRSTQLILDAAHAVVSRNSARKDKKLWTENAGGVRIQRFEAYNEEEEAEWIARQVEGLVGGRGSALTRRADDDGRPASGRATSRSCTG